MAKIDWRNLVESVEGHGPKEKDVAYRFSNGREFEREHTLYVTDAMPTPTPEPGGFPYTFPFILG